MNEMWNKRYSEKEYAYGIKPNEFFKQSLDKYDVKGKILLPAEGEGRNAVYAAKSGIEVIAFDTSSEGMKKAMKLADSENVQINYLVGELFDLDIINEKYDSAALIYAHFPPSSRFRYHQKISELIKTQGLIILEGFSVNNLELRGENPRIGGPTNREMLFTKDIILNEFPNFEILQLEEATVELKEGQYHNGIGKVIRFVGRKK